MSRALITAADLRATPIPQGAWGYWLGTYASVPVSAGWEVADGTVSSNDPSYIKPNLCHGRFVRTTIWTTDPVGETIGSTTHSHSVGSHSGHACSNAQGYTTVHPDNYGGSSFLRESVHTHPVGASSDTLSPVNNNPLNVSGIPIVYCKKSGPPRGIVTVNDLTADALPPWKLILGWHSDALPPAGWAKCYGSTVNAVILPDLRGKYLKGVASTAAAPSDGGGTFGAVHTHDVSHSHAASTTTGTVNVGGDDAFSALQNHTHSLGSQVLTSGGSTIDPAGVTTHWICFVGYGVGQAANARGTIRGNDVADHVMAPRGLVAVWCASSTPPQGWAHCDGGAWAGGAPVGYGSNKPNTLNRMIKHVADATTNGGVDDATSSDTHTHTAVGHTHLLSSTNPTGGAGGGTNTYPDVNPHGHTSGAALYSSLGNPTSSVPVHYKVAFIVRD